MTQDTNTQGQVPEALRSIQRFEVVDCIDDKHVPAVIPKPHGPWVRYEDHIAALAAGQATAAAQPVVPAEWPTNEMIDAGRKAAASQGRLLGSGQSLWHVFRAMLAAAPAQPAAQQGVAYAALPDERAAFEAWYIAQVRSKTSTTNDWSDDEIRGAWLSRPSEEYRSSFAGQSWEAWQARASHGQAPALTNLNCKSEQKRLATLWGFVPAQAASGQEDAARWQALPAFFEEYQIDAMKLYRDIDAYLAAARKQGATP